MAVGIICACLPSFRSLLTFLFSKATAELASKRDTFNAVPPDRAPSVPSPIEKKPSFNDDASMELSNRSTSGDDMVQRMSSSSGESSRLRLVPTNVVGRGLENHSDVADGSGSGRHARVERDSSFGQIQITQTIFIHKWADYEWGF